MRNLISIWLQRTQFGGSQQPETIAWNEGILMCQCEQDTRGGWQSIASAFVSRSELILIIHLPLSMMFNCSTYRPVFKWSHPFAVMIPFVNRNAYEIACWHSESFSEAHICIGSVHSSQTIIVIFRHCLCVCAMEWAHSITPNIDLIRPH